MMSLRPGFVKVVSETLTTDQAVRARLAALAGHEGWICYTDGWTWKSANAEGQSESPPSGFPLSAEIVVDARTSVQLRQSGAAWLWTQIQEVTSAAGAEEAQCWRRSFLSTVGSARSLQYDCWWRRSKEPELKPVYPWQPYVARFTGFVEGAE